MDRLLVDTNVLVYAYDPRDRLKQDVASALLRELVLSERAVVSAQCLSEFFSVVTTRLPEPLTRSEGACSRGWHRELCGRPGRDRCGRE